MISPLLKANARDLIRLNAPRLIVIGVVYLVAFAIISEIQIRLIAPVGLFNELRLGYITIEQFFGSISTSGLLLAFLLGIMLPSIHLGYYYYCIKITRKQDGDYKDLLIGFSILPKVIVLSLLITILTILWSLLFIIPGIVAHYRYRQAYYILLDDPSKSVILCIRESARIMNNNKLDLFLIDVSFLGWQMLSMTVQLLIPIFPIVQIWLTPYYGLTQAAYYNHLIKEATV